MFSGLESAKLKLIRAAEHIETVEASIAAYTAGDTYKVIAESNGEEEINIIRQPPPEISVLSGEIFYQVRSALDHLAFDLVKVNPQKLPLPNGWEKRCEFPLLADVPTYGNPKIPYDIPVPYRVFAKNLPGVTAQALTFIETVQPYHSADALDHRLTGWLRVLGKFSNIDKHRHLNITVTRIRKAELVSYDRGTQGSLSIVNDKAKLKNIIGTDHPMGRAMNVERSFAPIVTFGEAELPEIARSHLINASRG